MLGERLKELREEKGLSLREVAVQCDISKSAVDMYEKNKRNPKRETLEAFADLYNVDIDYLLGRTEIKNAYRQILSQKMVKNENSLEEQKLSEVEQKLLDIFRLIPEDQQKVFLEMGTVYANSLKKD